MKNKIQTLLFLAIFTIQYSFSQTNDTLYFDDNWKKTTKVNHTFYRPQPLKKIDNLSLIIDFHKNGNMQMQGYAYTDSLKAFVGDVYWYNKNGFDNSYKQYINSTNKPLKYYHNDGATWKTITYKKGVKDGIIKLFNDKDVLITSQTYKKGLIVNDTLGQFNQRYYSARHGKAQTFNKNIPDLKGFTKVVYWMYTGNIAKIIKYIDNTIVEDLTYTENRELVQHLDKTDFVNNELLNGKYYTLKTKNGFTVALDSVHNKNQKSKLIKLYNISYIGADENGNLDFYQKTAPNDYLKIDYELFYDEKIPEKSFRIFEEGYDDNTFEDIKKYSDKTIKVSDIKTQSVKNLLKTITNKEWGSTYIDSSSYSNKTTKHKIVFKQFNSELFTYLDLCFTERHTGGFGSSYKNDDDDIKKWRLNSSEFYTINILVLNNNKPILILSQGNDIKHYIIPTNNNGLLVNFNEKAAIEQTSSNLSESVFKVLMLGGNSNQFYSISSQKGKKYIANAFNEILVDKAYDSIQRKDQYIIAKNKEEIDIYNLKLDKLPINNIRQAYYDRGNMQILIDNNIKYINALGKETNRQNIAYSFCGTVSFSSFKIIKPKKKRDINVIEIISGYFGSGFENKKLLFLENLNAKYNVTFLNKTTTNGYDGNSRFVDGYVDRTHLLVATKNKKVGLYNYDDNVEFNRNNYSENKIYKDKNGILIIPDVVIDETEYGSTLAEELLPVLYDDIELIEPLIIVKKDKKYGIYPLKNGLKYKSLGKVNANFINYETISGEKGWIDINTLTEYPNKK